jgi:hypothetical protein
LFYLYRERAMESNVNLLDVIGKEFGAPGAFATITPDNANAVPGVINAFLAIRT